MCVCVFVCVWYNVGHPLDKNRWTKTFIDTTADFINVSGLIGIPQQFGTVGEVFSAIDTNPPSGSEKDQHSLERPVERKRTGNGIQWTR